MATDAIRINCIQLLSFILPLLLFQFFFFHFLESILSLVASLKITNYRNKICNIFYIDNTPAHRFIMFINPKSDNEFINFFSPGRYAKESKPAKRTKQSRTAIINAITWFSVSDEANIPIEA